MKKITIIAIAFVAVSFASCKKDYTCTCTSGGSSSTTKLIKVTKKTAQANCASTVTSSQGFSYTETCTLSK